MGRWQYLGIVGSLLIGISAAADAQPPLKQGDLTHGARNAQVTGPPRILSFTATPARIRRGATSTLRWEVSNAKDVWITRDRRLNTTVRIAEAEEASGEMRVRPERAARYQLHIRANVGEDVVREVTIRVEEASNPCTISGQVKGDQREYRTRVELYAPQSRERLFSTRVGTTGRYRFPRVPVGHYRISPRGAYPTGKLQTGPRPVYVMVTCAPDGSHTADFEIGSWEG